MTPWRVVAWFGVVSLAADMVYEGARSVTGPYLASLGASALVVGLVTGAGEAAALGFRLFSGPLADRSGRYWSWTVVGYAMTVVCVPLMALAPFVGRWVSCWPPRWWCSSGRARPCGRRRSRCCSPTLRGRWAGAGASRCTRRSTRSERSRGRWWSPASWRWPAPPGRRSRCWPSPGCWR